MLKIRKMNEEELKEEAAKIPTLVVEAYEKKKDSYILVSKGYLQPFRGYRFQISGSTSGQGDYGSSPVLGLANFLSLDADINATDSNSSIYASNSNVLIGTFEAFCNMAFQRFVNLHDCTTFMKYDSQVVLNDWLKKEVVPWLYKLHQKYQHQQIILKDE